MTRVRISASHGVLKTFRFAQSDEERSDDNERIDDERSDNQQISTNESELNREREREREGTPYVVGPLPREVLTLNKVYSCKKVFYYAHNCVYIHR